MKKFEVAVPGKVADVFEHLDTKGAVVKAGGIDLLDLMKEDIAQPGRLVNIRFLEELNFIKEDGKRGLIIGACVTLADLAENKLLQQDAYKALAMAAEGAATPQIRNAATIGGNLCQKPRCWYYRSIDFHCARKGGETCFAYDGENQYHAILGNDDGCAIVHPSATAVALMALNAKLKIVSKKNEREVPVESFYVKPADDITRENILEQGELITEIIIPPLPENAKSYYFKQKEKQTFDWPIADVAVLMVTSGGVCKEASVVLGSAAPIPWRSTEAENQLKGNKVTKDAALFAAKAAVKNAAPLSLNRYKVKVFETVIYRTICWNAGIDPLA